jgi:transposase
VHTIPNQFQSGPVRRRRRHSAEFKANVIAACKHPGVSIASVALAHGINANLLRRWIANQDDKVSDANQAPQRGPEPGFLPVQVTPAATRDESIRIELRRGATTMTITWPASAASECAAWVREVLR